MTGTVRPHQDFTTREDNTVRQHQAFYSTYYPQQDKLKAKYGVSENLSLQILSNTQSQPGCI